LLLTVRFEAAAVEGQRARGGANRAAGRNILPHQLMRDIGFEVYAIGHPAPNEQLNGAPELPTDKRAKLA
jgi:hypothetical protein